MRQKIGKSGEYVVGHVDLSDFKRLLDETGALSEDQRRVKITNKQKSIMQKYWRLFVCAEKTFYKAENDFYDTTISLEGEMRDMLKKRGTKDKFTFVKDDNKYSGIGLDNSAHPFVFLVARCDKKNRKKLFFGR